jgi:hypothetical protein
MYRVIAEISFSAQVKKGNIMERFEFFCVELASELLAAVAQDDKKKPELYTPTPTFIPSGVKKPTGMIRK